MMSLNKIAPFLFTEGGLGGWRRALVILVVLLFILSTPSVSQTWTYTHVAKGVESAYVLAMGIHTCGDRFVLGKYEGVTNFDNLSLVGNGYFLARYNIDDKIMWVKKIASVENENTPLEMLPTCKKLSFSGLDDDVVVTFNMKEGGVANFENTTVNAITESKLIIVKYDQNGNKLWLRDISMGISTPKTALPNNVIGGLAYDAEVDQLGNAIVTGRFVGNLDFGNGKIITSGTACQGNAFLAKFDVNGNALWAKSLGATGYSGGAFCWGHGENEVGVDLVTFGNTIYLTGAYKTRTNFDGLTITSNNPPTTDIFLAKFSQEGTVEWLNDIGGGDDWEYFSTLDCDENGNLYVGASFTGNAVFAGHSVSSDIFEDALWLKYSSDGSLLNFYHLAQNGVYNSAKHLTVVNGKIYTDELIFDTDLSVIDQTYSFWNGQFHKLFAYETIRDRRGGIITYGTFKEDGVSSFVSVGQWDGFYARYGPDQRPAINMSNGPEICQGSIVTLSATGVYQSYLWSTGEMQANILVDTSGSYSVRGIDGRNCLSQTSYPVTIKVKPPPEQPFLVADGSLSFCKGQSVRLSAPLGFVEYQWSNNSTASHLSVTTSGTYWVKTKNECGESLASDPMKVEVYDLPAKPSITSSKGDMVCLSEESTVLSTSAGFAGYVWSTGETTPTIPVSLYFSDTRNFWVRVKNENNCLSEPSETFTLTSLPSPDVVLIDFPEFENLGGAPSTDEQMNYIRCNGNSILLHAAILDEDPAQYDLLWSTGETTESINISQSGEYSVVAKYKTGTCYGGKIFGYNLVNFVDQQPPPKPAIQSPDGVIVCDNQEINLVSPDGFIGWLWSTGESSPSISVTEAGSYWLKTYNQCGESDASEIVIVSTNDLPPKPIISYNNSLTFCDHRTILLTGPEGYSYLWSDGSTSKEITVNTTGEYSLKTINECGESESSDVVSVQVQTCAQAEISNFDNIEVVYGVEPFVLSAITNSVNLISYSILGSDNTGEIELSGYQNEVVSVLHAGSIKIRAFVDESDQYRSSFKDIWITAKKSSQAITFDLLSEKDLIDEPFQIMASASSGLPLSFTSDDQKVATVQGNIITIAGAGQTNIIASQQGDRDYEAAENVAQKLVVRVVTGLEFDFNGPFQLYPNPAHTYLVIETKEDGDGTFQLIDSNGRYINNAGQIQVVDGSYTIDTSGLNKGTYFILFILQDGSKYIRRFVKE